MYDMLHFTPTINLPDGEQVNLYNPVLDFSKLVHDKLGCEAEHVFNQLIDTARAEGYEDGCSDEYKSWEGI